MKRFNKEYKLDVCNHISLKFGSVNKDNPQVIYVSGKCWILPTKEMDYQHRISSIERQFKEKIKIFFLDNENFDDKLILDFDINTDGLSPRKKKFLSFDFYLRQNERNKKSLTDLKAVVSRRTSTVSNNLVYLFKENNFQIEKRK